MSAAAYVPFAEPRRLSRAEYERLGALGLFEGERVELVRGILVRMSPFGPPHADVVDRLNELLVPPLVGRARVRIQQPFAAADDSEPEPDVAVVPVGRHEKAHPDRAFLIVEVAETSLDYDLRTKASLYAASGVPEYWVVDVGARAVEVRADPRGDSYASARRALPGDVLTPGAFPDVSFDVAALFA